MNKDEVREMFEKNVQYLKRNIPPDDIYMFSEQTFMACVFFIHRWSEWVDLREEGVKCPVTRKWLTNILSLKLAKEEGIDVDLDLDLESVE